MTSPDLASVWTSLGWQPSAAQLALFEQLQAELRSWNSRLNLTRLVEGDDFWIAQIVDSLWPFAELLQQQQSNPTALRLVDVGTGGGFPGLALAIALPAAQLALVDSVQRKVEAVRAMAASLGLSQRLSFSSERIEKLGHDKRWRGQFDWAVARAVAPAPVVAEYLVPLLNSGGQALLYRGQWGESDAIELAAAAQLLQARVGAVRGRELPQGRGQRHCLTLHPVAPCPRRYPRPIGIPAKQPLSGIKAGAGCA